MATIFHIRKPLRPARGSQFYKDRSNRGQGTYCGAPETQWDIKHSWKAEPFAGNFAVGILEPCQECTRLRDLAAHK